jgi:molecular chaperone GrpE (heat shock protein)
MSATENLNLKELLKEYIEQASSDIKTVSGIIPLTPDHISFLCSNSDDYLETIEYTKDWFEITKEIPHSGRRITIGKLKEVFKVGELELRYIEIAEPKPVKVDVTRKIDHLSFIPSNYEEFLSKSKELSMDLYDQVQIGDVKLCKWRSENCIFEFRSKGVGEENGIEQPFKVTNPNINEVASDSNELLVQELEKHKSMALRALADYQNLKKRVESEKETIQFFANTTLTSKLLIYHDFLRADEFVLKEEDHNKVREAYRSVHAKINTIISDFGLLEIPVNIGDKFDPHTMEAVGTLPVTDDKEIDIVKVVVQKGYKYSTKDTLVRPARVIIGKK